MPRHQYSDSSTTVSTVNNSCRNNIISNSETHTLIFFSLVFLCPFFSLAISYIQTAACMQAYMRAHGQFSRGFFLIAFAESSWCSFTKCRDYLTLLFADTTKSTPTHSTWKLTITDQAKHSNTLTLITSNARSYFHSPSFSPWFDPFQLSNNTQ